MKQRKKTFRQKEEIKLSIYIEKSLNKILCTWFKIDKYKWDKIYVNANLKNVTTKSILQSLRVKVTMKVSFPHHVYFLIMVTKSWSDSFDYSAV